MLPSLDPAQFSALFGVAVVQALAAVALFSSLQFGPALKVYFSGSLGEAGAGVVEVEVEVGVVVDEGDVVALLVPVLVRVHGGECSSVEVVEADVLEGGVVELCVLVRMLDVWVLGLGVIVADHDVWVGDILP